MFKSRMTWLIVGAIGGLVVGLNVAGVWPQVAVHASATHGQDNFAICTGLIDEDIEAVYFLDYLTGDLKAAVLSLQYGKFNAFFEYNVMKDLAIKNVKNPRYLMVSGVANLRRGATLIQPGKSVIYVVEATSGQVAAYGLPWIAARQASGAPQKGTFVPLDKIMVRTQAIRNTGTE